MVTLYEEEYVWRKRWLGEQLRLPLQKKETSDHQRAHDAFPETPLFCVGSSLSGRGHQIKNHVPQCIKPQSDTYHDYSEARIDGGGGMIWEERHRC